MRTICAAGALLAALFLCPPAAAQDDGRNEENNDAAIALAAGAGVAFLSLGAGGVMIARSKDERVKNAGLLGLQSGMVLAPFVAHAVVGEAKRGLWFSLPLLLPLASSAVVTGFYPSIIRRAPAGVQYATWIGCTLSILGATLGILDAARVQERKPKRSAISSFSLVPLLGAGTTGAMLSGSL